MLSVPVMGCDPHLDTLAAAVVDSNGAELAVLTVANTDLGWDQLVRLCEQHQVRTVGIEGASGYGRRLAQTLTGAGIGVKEVPTRLTARTRRVDGAGKSDPGDARTIGRAVARGEGHTWVDDTGLETLRVLTNRRDQLVTVQTADINQLRALLAEIDPETAARLPRLRSRKSLIRIARTEYAGDSHRETVARLIRAIAADCEHRLEQIRDLEQSMREVMPPVGWALIDQIHGCGIIVAAQLLSQLAGADQFATDAKLAAWAGTAPLDASSGRQQRHRLNRGGNRQANRAIHTIIITQHQQRGDAHHYITRRISEGKTPKEAIRAAKRHATRRIWKILHHHGLT